MKRIIYSITAVIAFLGIIFAQNVLPAFAAETLGGPKVLNEANRIENQASHAADKQSNELQNIINRANSLISNRLSSLNELSTRIQNDKRLSSSEKSSLSSDITTDSNGLTALKTKIDADTDVTTARADEKQIITSYYVYAVFEPKMRLLITLNNLQTITTNVQVLVPQLQNLINTYKSQGGDVTQLQSLLTDISTQLQTINTTITNDISTVEGVSTTSSSGASATFSKVRQDISQIVKTDFVKIRTDFSQMRPLFKELINKKPSGTPSQAAPSTAVASPSAAQ